MKIQTKNGELEVDYVYESSLGYHVVTVTGRNAMISPKEFGAIKNQLVEKTLPDGAIVLAPRKWNFPLCSDVACNVPNKEECPKLLSSKDGNKYCMCASAKDRLKPVETA